MKLRIFQFDKGLGLEVGMSLGKRDSKPKSIVYIGGLVDKSLC